MKERFGRLALLVLLCSFSLLPLSCNRESGGSPDLGSKAPDFSLKDLNGKTVSLEDYAGKVVLIEFWATWCPPCRESIPEMEGLFEKMLDRDLVVLGVSVDEGSSAPEKVKAFAERYNIGYTVLLDSGEASRKYRITSIPAIFIIDRNQKIVKKYEGFMPGMGKELERQISSLL